MIDDYARCLVDDRQPGKVRHTLEDLVAQRIYGLACGHPDANEADRLADDPIHKLLLGRDPIDGVALASQPTISRFENQVGSQALYAMGCDLAANVIDRHRLTIEPGPPKGATNVTTKRVFRLLLLQGIAKEVTYASKQMQATL